MKITQLIIDQLKRHGVSRTSISEVIGTHKATEDKPLEYLQLELDQYPSHINKNGEFVYDLGTHTITISKKD